MFSRNLGRSKLCYIHDVLYQAHFFYWDIFFITCVLFGIFSEAVDNSVNHCILVRNNITVGEHFLLDHAREIRSCLKLAQVQESTNSVLRQRCYGVINISVVVCFRKHFPPDKLVFTFYEAKVDATWKCSLASRWNYDVSFSFVEIWWQAKAQLRMRMDKNGLQRATSFAIKKNTSTNCCLALLLYIIDRFNHKHVTWSRSFVSAIWNILQWDMRYPGDLIFDANTVCVLQ